MLDRRVLIWQTLTIFFSMLNEITKNKILVDKNYFSNRKKIAISQPKIVVGFPII